MTIEELVDKHYKIYYGGSEHYANYKLSIQFAIEVLNECYQGLDPDNSTEEDIFQKIQELKQYLDEI